MVMSAANSSSNGSANHQRYRVLSSRPVTQLCGFVHDLIECGIYEICELDLGNRPEAIEGHTNRRSNDTAFRKGRIDDSLLAEFFEQALRDSEDSSDSSDILAEENDIRVTSHFQPKS